MGSYEVCEEAGVRKICEMRRDLRGASIFLWVLKLHNLCYGYEAHMCGLDPSVCGVQNLNYKWHELNFSITFGVIL